MDDVELIKIQPRLRSILSEGIWRPDDRDDLLQELNLALWKDRAKIKHPLTWAERWVNCRRIDRWRRENTFVNAGISSSEAQPKRITRSGCESLLQDCVSQSVSPLDKIVNTEESCQLQEARRRLAPGQQNAVESRLNETHHAQTSDGKPQRKPHHSNFCKAKANLRKMLGVEIKPSPKDSTRKKNQEARASRSETIPAATLGLSSQECNSIETMRLQSSARQSLSTVTNESTPLIAHPLPLVFLRKKYEGSSAA